MCFWDFWVYSIFLQSADGQPELCLGSDGVTHSFLNFLASRRKGKIEAALKAYVAYNSNCARTTVGKRRNGAYVENEMIAAVAWQNGIIIIVAERMLSNLQVITSDGTFLPWDGDRAQSSPFFLWCTGGHYQAIVPLRNLEVLDTALSKPSFIDSNVLSCDDICTQ